MKSKFELGQLVATAAVAEMLNKDSKFNNFVHESLKKYKQCNWGDTCERDGHKNDWALNHEERIFAIYKYNDEITIDIITEWDHSATTILFPEDY